jgi:hypothetical protein
MRLGRGLAVGLLALWFFYGASAEAVAREIRIKSATIPHGTLATASQTTSLAFPDRIVEFIEVRIPPGPRGEVGFRLATGGVQIIPYDIGTWVIGDNEVIHWGLEDVIETGAWQCIAYNTGQYDHTLYFRFALNILPQRSVAISVAPLATETIHGAAAASTPSAVGVAGPGVVSQPGLAPAAAGAAVPPPPSGTLPGLTPDQSAAVTSGQVVGGVGTPGTDSGTPLGGKG